MSVENGKYSCHVGVSESADGGVIALTKDSKRRVEVGCKRMCRYSSRCG